MSPDRLYWALHHVTSVPDAKRSTVSSSQRIGRTLNYIHNYGDGAYDPKFFHVIFHPDRDSFESDGGFDAPLMTICLDS
jgi:hypothetical protein